jgi:hypothetical protein
LRKGVVSHNHSFFFKNALFREFYVHYRAGLKQQAQFQQIVINEIEDQNIKLVADYKVGNNTLDHISLAEPEQNGSHYTAFKSRWP